MSEEESCALVGGAADQWTALSRRGPPCGIYFPSHAFAPDGFPKYYGIAYIDMIAWIQNRAIYDGLRRVSGLRGESVVSVKNPTLIPIPH